jgi:hypothetical protein
VDYFLWRYRQQVIQRRKAEQEIEAKLAELELQMCSENSIESIESIAPAMQPQALEMSAD